MRTLLATTTGALWALFGIATMLRPLGRATAYDASLGYDVVVDRALFVLYSLPGALALLLGAAALTAVCPRGGAPRVLALAAAGAGAVALGGIAAGFAPLVMGPQVLGTVVLGLAAAAAWRVVPDRRLLALGVAGVASLGVWPLVWAVELLPPAGGAALIALFGAGWASLGRLAIPVR